MKRTHMILIGIGGALTAASFALGVFGFIEGPRQTRTSSPPTSPALPDIGPDIPDGWHAHRMSGTHILLTRRAELPDIGATEGYAYGEQIAVSILPLETSPEEWIARKRHIDLDDPIVREAAWSIVDNDDSIIGLDDTTFLRVEHETPADRQLTYYMFEEERIYVFSLYPLEPLNEERLNALETVIRAVTPVGKNDRLRIDGDVTAIDGGWSEYRNEEQGLAFEYPSAVRGKRVFLSERDAGVTFYNEWRYGLISITVEQPSCTTLEKWLEGREARLGRSVYVEGETTIAGERALIMHTPIEVGAPLPDNENRSRRTVFLKNGLLYEIITRVLPYEDVSRLWESFDVL